MKYKIIVDTSKDIFSDKAPYTFKICDTKKEAEHLVENMYRNRHCLCLYEYYIEEIKESKDE